MAQVKKVWVPFDRPALTPEERKGGTHLNWHYPQDDDRTKASWAEVEALVAAGWQVVTAVPVTGSFMQGVSTRTVLVFTTGYEVILTRP